MENEGVSKYLKDLEAQNHSIVIQLKCIYAPLITQPMITKFTTKEPLVAAQSPANTFPGGEPY
jgi:hypothetical protein